MKTAMKNVANPNHVSQPSLENVRTEENRVIKIAEMRLKTTVHAPCSDSALKAVLHDTIPAPVIKLETFVSKELVVDVDNAYI